MKIKIQKFGGTSVSTQQKREAAADKIENSIAEGFSTVVVVSAIGRKGDPYATDTLLSMISSAESCLNQRDIDILLSCGEIISCAVLAETLEKRGFRCRILNGGQAGICTDSNYGCAEIIKIDTTNIENLLKAGIIPVIAGFQGITQNGEVTTLGRGGSDITAAALGEALNAELVEIYTDVDGIMIADPGIVQNPKSIKSIGYDEVFMLSDHGAKVIHPMAVLFAMRGNIPLVIKNTSGNTAGTLITSESTMYKNKITGIAQINKRAFINLSVGSSSKNFNLFNKIYELSQDAEFINIYKEKSTFMVNEADAADITKVMKEEGVECDIFSLCSRIAVIGSFKSSIAYMIPSIIKVLSEKNIDIFHIGEAHYSIWIVVKEKDTAETVNTLYNFLEL